MDLAPHIYLQDLFGFAVKCSHPENIFHHFLPKDRKQEVIVIGAGKASAAMACAFEKHWQGPISGTVVVPYGAALDCEHIEILQASHPVPDKSSVTASEAILKRTSNLSKNDIVYALISGGGSALLCAPAGDISLQEKQHITKALLKSGATIDEINIVRKKLSSIKGGRLLSHVSPAKLNTIAISDVVGDDPATISSGPTVEDHSTNAEALEILWKYNITTSKTIQQWLSQEDNRKVQPYSDNSYQVIASSKIMLKQVEEKIQTDGFNCINLGELDGDAKLVGEQHAKMAISLNPDKPTIIISGGETTVKVTGSGNGGRNSEYLLGLYSCLNDNENIYALSADTDGIDGMMDNAGAYFTPEDINPALKAKGYLHNNDSYTFFKKLGRLITTGPTHTNVNDFRAIYIAPSSN